MRLNDYEEVRETSKGFDFLEEKTYGAFSIVKEALRKEILTSNNYIKKNQRILLESQRKCVFLKGFPQMLIPFDKI